MPYISSPVRESLNDGRMPLKSGELNFVLAAHIDNYLVNHTVSYTSINDVIGVLECLKLEVYRRIAAPYEDKKISENGDVFVSRSQA